MKKQLGYIRVSTDLQEQTGYSLQAQKEDILKKAEQLGGNENEVIIIEDSESGSNINRPGLTKLRELIKEYSSAKIAVELIMYDPDRFARNLKDQLVVADELESLGAKLIFINIEYDKKNPESTLFFQLRGMISEFERTKILQRTSRGRLTKVKNDKKIAWNMMTYGYNFNTETDELEINEEQASIIKSIFNWYVNENISCTQIAKKLATMGIPTPKEGSKSWHASIISKIIKNEIYLGTYWAFKTKTIDGVKVIQPKESWLPISVPIIIEDTNIFNQAQIKIKDALMKHRGRTPDHQYLLRELVYCGRCGAKMFVSVTSPQNKKTYRYYTCNNKNKYSFENGTGNRNGCNGKVWNTDLLDEIIWKEVLNTISNPEDLIHEALNNENDNCDAIKLELKTIRTELQKIQTKEEGLVKLFIAEKINMEIYDKMKSEIDDKKNKLTTRQNELENLINQKQLKQDQKTSVIELLTQIKERIIHPEQMNINNRIQLLKKIINKIVLFDDGTIRIEGIINYDNYTHHQHGLYNWHKNITTDVRQLEEQIWQLYESKVSFTKIGKQLGISKAQVDYRLRKMRGLL